MLNCYCSNNAQCARQPCHHWLDQLRPLEARADMKSVSVPLLSDRSKVPIDFRLVRPCIPCCPETWNRSNQSLKGNMQMIGRHSFSYPDAHRKQSLRELQPKQASAGFIFWSPLAALTILETQTRKPSSYISDLSWQAREQPASQPEF